MECQRCGLDFEEKLIDASHDVPCYMFDGKDRKEKKNQADKYGRHNLCKKCHDIYERIIISVMVEKINQKTKEEMILVAKEFSKQYFKLGGDHDPESRK